VLTSLCWHFVYSEFFYRSGKCYLGGY